MPQTISDSEGNEKEVFTQEELEAQKQEAIEQYKSENPDKSEEIQKLQTELEETKKSLEGVKDKDVNVGKLKEGYEKRIETLEKNIDTKMKEVSETTKKEVMEGVMKDFYSEELDKFSDGDDELKKKIEYHYKRISDPTATKADVTKKLTDAFKLAGGEETQGNTAFSSGGASKVNLKQTGLTEDDKDLLRKMGKGHLVDKDGEK